MRPRPQPDLFLLFTPQHTPHAAPAPPLSFGLVRTLSHYAGWGNKIQNEFLRVGFGSSLELDHGGMEKFVKRCLVFVVWVSLNTAGGDVSRGQVC